MRVHYQDVRVHLEITSKFVAMWKSSQYYKYLINLKTQHTEGLVPLQDRIMGAAPSQKGQKKRHKIMQEIKSGNSFLGINIFQLGLEQFFPTFWTERYWYVRTLLPVDELHTSTISKNWNLFPWNPCTDTLLPHLLTAATAIPGPSQGFLNVSRLYICSLAFQRCAGSACTLLLRVQGLGSIFL